MRLFFVFLAMRGGDLVWCLAVYDGDAGDDWPGMPCFDRKKISPRFEQAGRK